MKKYRKHFAGIAVIVLLLTAYLIYLSTRKEGTVAIGMVGCMSGNLSHVGVSVREGVRLAVREMNEQGGIRGRQIKLIVRDDKSDIDTGIAVVQELVSTFDVDLIIGPVLSSMTPVVEKFKSEPVLFASPTMSSSKLSIQDDNFIRFDSPTSDQAKVLYRHISEDTAIRTVSVIFDNRNREYSEDLLNLFSELVSEDSVLQIKKSIAITKGTPVEIESHVSELLSTESNAILVITSAIDFAHIAQYMKRKNAKAVLYGSQWASTLQVVEHGGSAVEMCRFVSMTSAKENSQELIRFRTSFKEMYDKKANFINQLGYETARILFKTMDETGAKTPEEIRDSVIQKKVISVLGNHIRIDSLGDSHRTLIIRNIVSGQFQDMQ